MEFPKQVYIYRHPEMGFDGTWETEGDDGREAKEYILAEAFSTQMVFANMLRLWKAEDIKSFYDMLGRRPECAELFEKFPEGTEKLLGSILGPLEDYMNNLDQPKRPNCVIDAEVVIGQILADKACMKTIPLHPDEPQA